MADSKRTDQTERIFVKEVAGVTRTRRVTSAQAETEALFEGYREQKTSKSGSGGAKPAATGGSTA